jgi:hypothetical protein
LYAKEGRGGDTFAHPVLALAYAEFLNPSLGVEVREVFLRYKGADATLADDILQRAPAADNEWAGARALGRSQRSELTATLKEHQVTIPREIRASYKCYLCGTDGQDSRSAKSHQRVEKER